MRSRDVKPQSLFFGLPLFPQWTFAAVLLALLMQVQAEVPISLLAHFRSSSELGELRDIQAEWTDGVLKLSTAQAERQAWAVIPAPDAGWDLARSETVNAEIYNSGDEPIGVMFWVVGRHGWDAVLDMAAIAPHQTRSFSCDLRAAFPDGTPKINPGDVRHVQIMLAELIFRPQRADEKANPPPQFGSRITRAVSVEVRKITAQGLAPEWKRPAGRIDVPDIESCAPAPGKRVRYRLLDDALTDIYSVLNLPEDWRPNQKYPVIVEYPGNVFYAAACYSTGLPDQCVIGYGMTKGKGAICLGMPFLDRVSGKLAENGWGNAADTADYVIRMVAEVCAKFGGDRDNVVLTGFSRGAIACGYIGLRDSSIAGLWKGFHACQHYDGDGWNGETLEGAIERASRFQGAGVFQTDNPEDKFRPVTDVMKTQVTWAHSGLGFHSTAMFLDDRPSTQQLRQWFWKIVEKQRP
ncbi:MAG: hypothetical protein DVB28_000942 [Verrucomicrobia bacterium]|nr:MAG: hypothetical protein DVB28_000942 [Verrucomicrobiota bacterium]